MATLQRRTSADKKRYGNNNVTGSRKTRLLEQTKILVINVPSDRAEHCLHNDMLSVHIPSFIPELCALETRSRKM